MNLRRDRTVLTVAGLTFLSLLVRLAFLGDRVAHFDEGRVAYWILEYSETGVLFYRPIIHGPLLHLLNGSLFGLFGPTDFVMRLVSEQQRHEREQTADQRRHQPHHEVGGAEQAE